MLRSDDRRRQVKSANHRAILDAAAALAEERGLGAFSVQDLAERAGVSRRTIFNHFTSVEDAVHARFSEILGVLVDDFVSAADALPAAEQQSVPETFRQIVHVIARTELVGPLSRLVRLTDASRGSPHTVVWARTVIDEVTARLAEEITRRNPAADPFAVTLMASAVIDAVRVTAEEWSARTGAVDTLSARAEWHRLLDTAFEQLRVGFAPDHS